MQRCCMALLNADAYPKFLHEKSSGAIKPYQSNLVCLCISRGINTAVQFFTGGCFLLSTGNVS